MFPRFSHVIGVLAATTLALSGCGAMVAQSPSGRYTPVNAVADGANERVLLKGADVVAYFTEGRYVAGKPEISTSYENITLRFSSAENKALFEKEPGKYLPQYGGYCTNGIAYGIPWGGDADMWKMIDGKLYIFGGMASKEAFELDEKGNLALAEKYWKEEIAGGNSFLQRAKRLIFRVPHYKSGEELAQAIAAAKAGKAAQ